MRQAVFVFILSNCLVSASWGASMLNVPTEVESRFDEQQPSQAREAQPRLDRQQPSRITKANPRIDGQEPVELAEEEPWLEGQQSYRREGKSWHDGQNSSAITTSSSWSLGQESASQASMTTNPSSIANQANGLPAMSDGHAPAHSSIDDLDDLLTMASTWGGILTSHSTNEREGESLAQRFNEKLNQARVTHMHARSVINELQERQDAQETDLTMLKNELTRLRSEQISQRDQLSSLGAATSDAAWALADMKQGQTQSSADFSAFKLIQAQAAEDLNTWKLIQAQLSADLVSIKQVQAQVSADLEAFKLVQAQTITDLGLVRLAHSQTSKELTELRLSGDQTAEDLSETKLVQAKASAELSELRRTQHAMLEDVQTGRQVASGLVDAVGALVSQQGTLEAELDAVRQVLDHQNDTLLVMEAVMMGNAVELQTLHRHSSTARCATV